MQRRNFIGKGFLALGAAMYRPTELWPKTASISFLKARKQLSLLSTILNVQMYSDLPIDYQHKIEHTLQYKYSKSINIDVEHVIRISSSVYILSIRHSHTSNDYTYLIIGKNKDDWFFDFWGAQTVEAFSAFLKDIKAAVDSQKLSSFPVELIAPIEILPITITDNSILLRYKNEYQNLITLKKSHTNYYGSII